jgi:hypothetical protein
MRTSRTRFDEGFLTLEIVRNDHRVILQAVRESVKTDRG